MSAKVYTINFSTAQGRKAVPSITKPARSSFNAVRMAGLRVADRNFREVYTYTVVTPEGKVFNFSWRGEPI